MTPPIQREFKRRAAIEPVIGHLKDDRRMDRSQIAIDQVMRYADTLRGSAISGRPATKTIRNNESSGILDEASDHSGVRGDHIFLTYRFADESLRPFRGNLPSTLS